MKKRIINHLKSQDISSVVAGNEKIHIKKSNGTVDVASSNHDESDTLIRYCLGHVDLKNKVVCVKPNDTRTEWFDFINCLVKRIVDKFNPKIAGGYQLITDYVSIISLSTYFK